jgi:DNA phosphorothioation-dependent restriction protein DptH
VTDRARYLADLLVADLDVAAAGHCLRVDDLTRDEAVELRGALLSALGAREGKPCVWVRVLDGSGDEGSVTIEQAIGLRNDVALPDGQGAILALLVPPTFARAASSLDNAFQRVPYAQLLEAAGRRLVETIQATRPRFPANQMARLAGTRLPVEYWLDFLESVEASPDQPFGEELWRIGLMPDGGSDDDVKGRLADNALLVRKVADRGAIGHSLADRLRQAHLSPGDQFDRLVDELAAMEDQFDDPRAWTKAIADRTGLKFDELAIVKSDNDSDLENLEVSSFRSRTGTVPRSSGLVLVDERLECHISDDDEGKVVVKWRTTPSQTTRVHHWQLRLRHPDDLRGDEEPDLAEMRVAGSRRTATLKLQLKSEDVSGGYLFVVEVVPLDDNDQAIELPDTAIPQSEPFELIFKTAESLEQGRASTEDCLGTARLRAVSKGVKSLDEDHAAWDCQRQQFSVRIGQARAVQVPFNATVVGLQRKIVAEPKITGFDAHSAYGLALDVNEFTPRQAEVPAAFARKRAQVMEMLRAGVENRNVPEVFAWTDDSRNVVLDYLASYKRALEGADQHTAEALQRLDTVDLSLGKVPVDSTVTLVLPLHPLRLAWIATFDELTRQWAEALLERSATAASSKNLIDFDVLPRIAPTNIPFTLLTPSHKTTVYFDELVFGVGLLLPLGHQEPEVLASTVCTVLGLTRQSTAIASDATMISDRLRDYRTAHSDPKALRVAAMNPGDGAVLADALGRFLDDAGADQPRLDIIGYGHADRYAQPLAALTRLQVGHESPISDPSLAVEAGDNQPQTDRIVKQSPLFPPLGAALRPPEQIGADRESIHVAIASGISIPTVVAAPEQALERFASLEDLLCPLVTTPIGESESGWTVSPALHARTTGTLAASVVAAHRAHQNAVGATLDLSGPPALHVDVVDNRLDDIRILHERSDWVLTLDRFVGLNFYESGHFHQGATSYILDYAPDFIDGMSHRLTVTTSHRAEVTSILKRAMTELGLDALDGSATQILDDLMTVSGRLILRLQSSAEGFARESVSLAALISHLRQQGKLDDTIIVPVDAHHEIFGRTAPGNATGRRCDMLMVRVGQQKFRIECVEVKSRRHAALPKALADDIADQLENTKALLEQRYFTNDPPRIDASLQRAQLAGLLHYYADRAVTNGLIAPERVATTHKHIDRLVEGGSVDVQIDMHGYVISLAGAEAIPTSHRGIQIDVLTAGDLGKLGFSVSRDAAAAAQSQEKSATHAPATKSSDDPSASDNGAYSGAPTPGPSDSGPGPHRETETGDGQTSEPGRGDSAAPESDTRDTAPEERTSGPSQSSADRAGDSSDRADISPGVEEPTTSDQAPVTALRGATDVQVPVGRDPSGGLVTWAPSTKGSPHAFIVGIPGQGKSVTTRRLIRELAQQQLPALVIDFHGDMAANPPANAEVLRAEDGLPFTPFDVIDSTRTTDINQAAWELAEVIQFVGAMGEIQRSNVYRALQDVYATAIAANTFPTLSQFAEALEAVERGGRAKNARERVRPLTDFGLFDESASRTFNPRAAGMVVDLSKLKLDEVQITATSFLLRRVYRDMFSWPQDGTLKLAIVLDEAHRVARDVTLPKLMKEGRKYGVVVVVASQGLADFHSEVLGNAGMKVVFRTNHPESRSVVRYLRGRAGQDLAIEVEKLGVGQAYVATADNPVARKTTMFE